MVNKTPPKVLAVKVVAVAAVVDKYLVRVQLENLPPATGHGWALYLGELRIPKYWEYGGSGPNHGVCFEVFEEQFFVDHSGEQFRWSENDTEFVDTGVVLPAPTKTP